MAIFRDGIELFPGMSIRVAASNASDESKASAHFLCTGVDDQDTIDLAIAALPVIGGKITLSDGTFNIAGDSHVTLVTNLVIEGQGRATIVEKATPYTDREMFYVGDSPGGNNKDNLEFRNMTIDCGTATALGDSVRAIHTRVMKNLVIDNVHVIEDNNKFGELYLFWSDNIQISDCTFDGVRVFINGQNGADDTAMEGTDCTVTGCIFKNSPVGTFALGNSANRFTITGNTFYNVGLSAIDTYVSTDCSITGNVIDTTDDNGIWLEGARRVTITGNTIRNIVDGAGMGIINSDVAHNLVSGDIIIENNYIENMKWGIVLRGSPETNIGNNIMKTLTAGGILLQNQAGSDDSDDCIIHDNIIENFGAVTGGSAGIDLRDVERCDVHDNHIDGNGNAGADYGVKESNVAAACDSNYIHDNRFISLDTAGVLRTNFNTLIRNNYDYLDIDTTNVDNPPTDAQLDAAFGTPATVGAGWEIYLDDNNAHTDIYRIVSDGTRWLIFTAAVAA